jgi:hypothetical protein
MLSKLFADDTACIASHKDLPTLINYVNDEIQKIANWFRANKMAVNISKTKYIVFHGKGKPVNMGNLNVVYNNNDIGKFNDPANISILERVYNNHPNKDSKSYKLLGVHLDETLSFKTHIENIGNKISKSLYIINRVKNFLPKKSLRNLFFAVVHPHLTYCLNIYSCTAKSNLNRLIILQKRAIRAINLANYNSHTSQLFTDSKILPLDKLITQAKLLFMHSVEYGYCLPTFNLTWCRVPAADSKSA